MALRGAVRREQFDRPGRNPAKAHFYDYAGKLLATLRALDALKSPVERSLRQRLEQLARWCCAYLKRILSMTSIAPFSALFLGGFVIDLRWGTAMDEDDVNTARVLLHELHDQISTAQATLMVMNQAIQNARSDPGAAALHGLMSEIEHLRAQNILAAEQVDTANAALEEAVRVSETDSLTRLPNRVVLWDRLHHDLDLARRQDTILAVVFLDLDDFKRINDELGHDVGDALLKCIASDLSTAVRASDTVCRIGGDEFVLVMPDVRLEALDLMLKKIQAVVMSPRLLHGQVVVAAASMGYSTYPGDGETPETLVKQADLAMYRAKRAR